MNRSDLTWLQDDSVSVAQALLGWRFYHLQNNQLVGGIIVETEAYSSLDAASHTYRGETMRNRTMFGPAGHLYVYFTYGMHYCANIVTGKQGDGQGVLLRTLIPDTGLDIMRERRLRPDHELTNGPAKICQALGIGKEHNGSPLSNGEFYLLEPNRSITKEAPSRRIGITQNVDALWRFTATI